MKTRLIRWLLRLERRRLERLIDGGWDASRSADLDAVILAQEALSQESK